MSAGLRALLPQVLSIVMLGVGVGLAGNRLSPRGLPLIAPRKPVHHAEGFITLAHAQQFWQSGSAFFLDAREPADYAAGHIGNALNLPAQSFAQHFGQIAPLLTPESPLVVYCDGKECDLSHRLADSLRQQGHTNVHILANGWTVWKQAGLPTASGGQK